MHSSGGASSASQAPPPSSTSGASWSSMKAFPTGLRVLVVDDDPLCLMILERMLRRCSYTVTTCNMAKSALAMLREDPHAFDLVISDVNMPDMDGFHLLELIGLEMDLPVIMMSSEGETGMVMRGIVHGACDYLVKPVRMEELRNIWQHVVRRRASQAGSKLDENSGGSHEDAEADTVAAGALGLARRRSPGPTALTPSEAELALQHGFREDELKAVHSALPSLAGTNGYGSVSAIAATLRTIPAVGAPSVTSPALNPALAAASAVIQAGNLSGSFYGASGSPSMPSHKRPFALTQEGFLPHSVSEPEPTRQQQQLLQAEHLAQRSMVDLGMMGGLGGLDRPFGGGVDVKVSGLGAMCAALGDWQSEEGVEFGYSSKRPRVMWSVELHQKFVAAVNQLGVDKAVPKRILEVMGVPGLTRENVASHLQKYRLCLKRLSGAQDRDKLAGVSTSGGSKAGASSAAAAAGSAPNSGGKEFMKEEVAEQEDGAGSSVRSEVEKSEGRQKEEEESKGQKASLAGLEHQDPGRVQPGQVDARSKGEEGDRGVDRSKKQAEQLQQQQPQGGEKVDMTNGKQEVVAQRPAVKQEHMEEQVRQACDSNAYELLVLQQQQLLQQRRHERQKSPSVSHAQRRSASPPLLHPPSQQQLHQQNPMFQVSDPQADLNPYSRSSRLPSPSLLPSPTYTCALSPTAAGWQARALSRSPPPPNLSPDMGRVHRQLLALRAGIGIPTLSSTSASLSSRAALQASLDDPTGGPAFSRLSALLQQQQEGAGDAGVANRGVWASGAGGAAVSGGLDPTTAAAVAAMGGGRAAGAGGFLGPAAGLLVSGAVAPRSIGASASQPVGFAATAPGGGSNSNSNVLEQALALLVQQQQQLGREKMDGEGSLADQQLLKQQIQALLAQHQADKAQPSTAPQQQLIGRPAQSVSGADGLPGGQRQQLFDFPGSRSTGDNANNSMAAAHVALASAATRGLPKSSSNNSNDDLLLQFLKHQKGGGTSDAAPGPAHSGRGSESAGSRGDGRGGGSAGAAALRLVRTQAGMWNELNAGIAGGGGGVAGGGGGGLGSRQAGGSSVVSGSYEAPLGSRLSEQDGQGRGGAGGGQEMSAGSVGQGVSAAGLRGRREVGEAYSTVRGRESGGGGGGSGKVSEGGLVVREVDGDAVSNMEVTSKERNRAAGLATDVLNESVAGNKGVREDGNAAGWSAWQVGLMRDGGAAVGVGVGSVGIPQLDKMLLEQLRQTAALSGNKERGVGLTGEGDERGALLSMPTFTHMQGADAAAEVASAAGSVQAATGGVEVDALVEVKKNGTAATASGGVGGGVGGGEMLNDPALLMSLPSLSSCGALLSDLIPRSYSTTFGTLPLTCSGGTLGRLPSTADEPALVEAPTLRAGQPLRTANTPSPVRDASREGNSFEGDHQTAGTGRIGGQAPSAGLPSVESRGNLMLEGLFGREEGSGGFEGSTLMRFESTGEDLAAAVAALQEGAMGTSGFGTVGAARGGAGSNNAARISLTSLSNADGGSFAVPPSPMPMGGQRGLEAAPGGSLSADDLERFLEAVP